MTIFNRVVQEMRVHFIMTTGILIIYSITSEIDCQTPYITIPLIKSRFLKQAHPAQTGPNKIQT